MKLTGRVGDTASWILGPAVGLSLSLGVCNPFGSLPLSGQTRECAKACRREPCGPQMQSTLRANAGLGIKFDSRDAGDRLGTQKLLVQNRFESGRHGIGFSNEGSRLPYKADIAGGSLKVYESRIVANLLLQRLSPAAWRQAIEVENVLQKTSIGTAKRQASLIKARLKFMTPAIWALVRDGAKPVATQAVFASAIAHSPLLRDFLAIYVRDRFLSGDLGITRRNVSTKMRQPGREIRLA